MKKNNELVEVLKPFEVIPRQRSGDHFVIGSHIIVSTSGITHVCSVLKTNSYNVDGLSVVESLQTGIANRFNNIEYTNTAGILLSFGPPDSSKMLSQIRHRTPVSKKWLPKWLQRNTIRIK